MTSESQGIFSSLIGHGGAKAVLRAAIRQGGVHIMLEGPPASGKSVALLCIEEYVPGAHYKGARGFTERELRDQFARNPEILLLDELDAAKNDAYEAMSMPMEQGRVTKDTNHEQYDKDVDVQVFAAVNDASDLPAHTASRFRTLTFEEYTHDEFVDVCERLLVEAVEWVATGEDARYIAEKVYNSIGSRDPRDARDAARLAGQLDQVDTMAEAIADPKADVESVPITEAEIKRIRGGGSAQDAYQSSNPMDGGGIPPTEWEQEACDHLTQSENADQARQFGRFLCPACAKRHGVDATTPLSQIDHQSR